MHLGAPSSVEKRNALKRFLEEAENSKSGQNGDLYKKRQCVATYGPTASGYSSHTKISGGGNTPFSR